MSLFPRHKILLVCLFAFLFFASLLFWFLLIPPSQAFLNKIIVIKKGMPLRKISALLEQEGIIRNREFFIGMVTLLGNKKEIKAGEYEFHPPEVIQHLIEKMFS